ncbi:hypothetical protein PAXRUDRAFT_533526 [Paxillus rubicundulus Ve08.2h10]|uniref:Uncharacterized protein n=1 Tax=Paxillus rubicundulus Ve08.2h10 TaxID=930991 RepID=A0A0D0DW48_9AGAM|nr:hypothetical protein PAXRUDRAFT_533526 [Paxillus rubicundulus Ve08.2h10]
MLSGHITTRLPVAWFCRNRECADVLSARLTKIQATCHPPLGYPFCGCDNLKCSSAQPLGRNGRLTRVV